MGETLCYGFLACNYFFTLYVTLMPSRPGSFGSSNGRSSKGHVTVMLKLSTLMFLVATLHFSVSFYRAWIAFRGDKPMDAAFLRLFNTWHRVSQDLLFVTQESLGSAAAIYRAWILWGKDWRVLSVLLVALVAEMRFGLCIIYIYTPSGGVQQALHFKNLFEWIKAHAIIIVCLNFTTTLLMVLRVWKTQYESSKYFLLPSMLEGVWRILLESAMLQLITELLSMIMVFIDPKANFIMVQIIVPIIVSIDIVHILS
ncbi:hypothetical protein PM082_016544 [Marasmius tenuissimus]|nr:hypothetical protein PM082_016544 [Marasmius tenuissimus]